MEELIKLTIQLGAFGVLAWLIFHLFTKTIPKMIADFQKALDEERACGERARQEFLNALDGMRRQHAADREAWLNELRNLRETLDRT